MAELTSEIRDAVEAVMRAATWLEGALARAMEVEYRVYSQRNCRWSGDRLGPDAGGGTLGGSGCAVTCAAMQAAANGCAVTPGELNQWLIEHDGFSAVGSGPRNELRWEKIVEFCPLLEYWGKKSWRTGPADVVELRGMMEERGPVVVEVDFDYRDLDVDQHFVVALEWMEEDEVLIADPWDGQQVGLVERYFNPGWSAPKGKVARVVTGVRGLQAKLGKLGIGD